MPSRYAPLPNPRTDTDADNEMEAAFDDSDAEDYDDRDADSRPLTQHSQPATPSAHTIPGAYDFENVDYDYPPPGSPPRPSASALPNEYGNSNGFLPQSPVAHTGPRQSWWRRTAGAVLPTHFVRQLDQRRGAVGIVGGGTNNDGVFANVTAKPAAPRQIVDGDETYLVPEDTQKEAPPSYATAQADAVPPYWETTVHAPSSPGAPGEMIIDSLPTGSLFSFLWNMLVSISFQFVGFLLTYLLHTTHAAKLGSRAGLGITLIQYGFALRARGAEAGLGGGDSDGTEESWGSSSGGWTQQGASVSPTPSFDTSAEADAFYKTLNTTMPGSSGMPAIYVLSDATTEWLSFFLMTVGWFILLTSALGFWRVKRWERGILASNRSADTVTPGQAGQDRAIFSNIEQVLGLTALRGGGHVMFDASGHGRRGDEEAGAEDEIMIPIDPNDPNRDRIIAEARANEARLMQDLRSAGLL